DLDRELTGSVQEMAEAVDGTVAVVTPTARVAPTSERLSNLLAAYGGRVQVFDGLRTKGLEFDGVVVVQPDEIVGESPSGWRTLYVVLTRATQRLLTLGTGDDWLRRARGSSGAR